MKQPLALAEYDRHLELVELYRSVRGMAKLIHIAETHYVAVDG